MRTRFTGIVLDIVGALFVIFAAAAIMYLTVRGFFTMVQSSAFPTVLIILGWVLVALLALGGISVAVAAITVVVRNVRSIEPHNVQTINEDSDQQGSRLPSLRRLLLPPPK